MTMPSYHASAQVTVPVAPAAAFAAFVEGFGGWWPRASTWSQDGLERIALGAAPGELCTEVGPHGFRCDWGRVLALEPPHRLLRRGDGIRAWMAVHPRVLRRVADGLTLACRTWVGSPGTPCCGPARAPRCWTAWGSTRPCSSSRTKAAPTASSSWCAISSASARSHCATGSASTTGRCPRSPRSCRSPGARRWPPLSAAPARCRLRCASRGRCPRPCAAAGCPPRSSTTGSTPWTRGRAWRTGARLRPRPGPPLDRGGRADARGVGQARARPVGDTDDRFLPLRWGAAWRNDPDRAARTDAAPRRRALLAGRVPPTGVPELLAFLDTVA